MTNPSTNTLRILQSALISLQIINGGIAGVTSSPVVGLVLGAVLGGLQFYVHNAVGSDVVVVKKDGTGVEGAS